MFQGYHIDSITNGVHVSTWACKPVRELFDRHIPDWHTDNASLRSVINIPREELWQAHHDAKRILIEYVNKTCNAGMDFDVFTIGFARRSTQYKRATLIFSDIERLNSIVDKAGPIQLIFSGKAHPRDESGKELIKQIFQIRDSINNGIRIAYIPDYDMDAGGMMTSGSDLWLNTPLPPMEASGTSGMKAAINGVPSLSVLDGWWIEGCIEDVTGWAIGDAHEQPATRLTQPEEVNILYDKLQNRILPLYYLQRDEYIKVMRNAIALNASFFNAERMLNQYVAKAYFK
jgi:starch phosphorylase